MKRILLSIIILLLMGCSNRTLLRNDKIILDNVYEIDFETAHNGIQIELDNNTQERLIQAFNNIPFKLEYTWDDAGGFGWMNCFAIEGEEEEIKVAYLPLHSAISINGQKYFIPLDCEFYEIIFELEQTYETKGFKFYDDMRDFLSEDGINLLPIDSYALVGPSVQINDILKKLEISTDKEYKMSVKEYIDSKYKEVVLNGGYNEIDPNTSYRINAVYELDNMEFKTIEIFGHDLGIVLFKYNK